MDKIFGQLIDLKISIAGLLFFAISISDIEISLKIIGSIMFIGYTFRRWYIMERTINNQTDKQNQDEAETD